MKQLIIIGAGGFGRELFGVAREALGYGTAFVIKGFLDDNLHALDGFHGYPPILGTLADYTLAPDDVFITALGNVKTRKACATALAARGAKFQAIVHTSAYLGPNTVVAPGAFIANYAVLTADVVVGAHACVFPHAAIGHDCRLGAYSHIYASVVLGGGVQVGDCAVIYPGANVVPRITIGADATVGIGATVVAEVPAQTTVFGNPARPLA